MQRKQWEGSKGQYTAYTSKAAKLSYNNNNSTQKHFFSLFGDGSVRSVGDWVLMTLLQHRVLATISYASCMLMRMLISFCNMFAIDAEHFGIQRAHKRTERMVGHRRSQSPGHTFHYVSFISMFSLLFDSIFFRLRSIMFSLCGTARTTISGTLVHFW